MLPRSSSTGNLRRSSILKPPKSRQPFQDLDFNASSPDDSPENTKRRRVSFAEKKHVKEFCDLEEKGTIWDNTYEEADQNFSKLTDTANEDASNNDPQIGHQKNGHSLTEAAGFDSLGSRNSVIMDTKSVEHSVTKISLDSTANTEHTYVISRCQGVSNDQIARTNDCEDTEGIEPTFSIKKNVGFEPPPLEIEKTTMFENSESDMKFTQVITSKTCHDTMPRYLSDPEFEKTNPFAENRTIIFEDSTMDLTLPKSDLIPGSESILTTETNDSSVPVGTEYCLNNYSESNYKTTQWSDKTKLFDDLGCDMTKPIESIIHRLPRVDLMKSNDPPVEPNGDVAPKINSAEIRVDLGSKTSGESNCDVLEPRDATIFFNDYGCEMTEAVDSLRRRLNLDQNEKTNESDQIVPFQSPEMNRKSDEFMNMETCGSEIPSSSCEPGEKESRLKSKADDKNRTKFANESAMDFTTAITSAKNYISEQNLPAASSDSNINVVAMQSGSNFENRDNCSHIDMSFTKIINREPHGNENKRLSESSEHIESKRCCNSSIDQNSGCGIDLTEIVCPAAPHISNSNQNLEENNSFSNSVSSSADLHVKRKSSKRMEEIEADEPSYSWLNKNPEQESLSVQSLAHNGTVNLTSNCKRSKVADLNATANSEPAENVGNNLASISSSKSCETQEIKDAISTDVTTANDRVTPSTDECVLHDENTSLICAQYLPENDERSTIDRIGKTEADGEFIEGISAEEEPSFLKKFLGEEEEMMELSLTLQRHPMSRNESNNELEKTSESSICSTKSDEFCFLMFKEGLEKSAERDECIWQIRSVDTKHVLIDFISKSLIVVISLEENTSLTSPHTIKEIKFVSLLSDSEDGDIALVHDILLKKLNPEELKQRHKTTLDILSLLEVITQRVKLLIDFINELENLRDFHIMNRVGNRISIHLHSYRVTLAIKITVDVEPFEDIGPNDVTMECILGNIREKDVKQLIRGVKKDHKFLTNFVNDIKEYIALVHEY